MKNGILKALLTQKFIYNSGNKTLKKLLVKKNYFQKGNEKEFSRKHTSPMDS